MTSKIHLLALCASLPLFAEDVSWIAPGAGSWNGAGNWDSGVVPCVIDRAVFSSTNGLVTLNSSSTVEGLDLMFRGLLPMFVHQRQTLTITGPITGTGGLDLQGYTAGSSGDMGTIRLYSTESSFEGGIRCGGGTFRFVSAAGGAIPSGSSLGTGDILLDGGMFSTIFPEVASTSSGYPQSPALPGLTNRVRVSERGGRFHFNVGSGGNNAGMMLGDIELGGPIELQSQGGGNSHGYSLMGTLTLLQDQERTLRFQNGTSHNGDDHLAGPILDGEGEAGNPLHLGVTVRPLYISSMQATYAGGTVIETCGASAVTVRPRTQLGTGDVSIRSGGALVLQNPTPLGVDGNLAASARVRVEQGGILECGLNGFSLSGTREAGSPVVTFSGTASTVNCFRGQAVKGTGIPADTTILSIDSDRQITLSQSALSSGTSNLSFAGNSSILENRITSDSSGIFGISGQKTLDLDQASMGNGEMFIGSFAGGTLSGLLQPGSNQCYRLGGGLVTTVHAAKYSATPFVLATQNALSGDASLIAGPGTDSGGRACGLIRIQADNSYTGGTEVRAGTALTTGKTGGTPFGSGCVHVLKDGILGTSGLKGSFYDGIEQYQNYVLHPGATLFFFEQTGELYAGENGGQGRWGDTEPMRLINTRLHVGAPKNAKVNENIGAFYFGDSVQISFTEGGGTSHAYITADSLERMGHGILLARTTLGSAFRLRTPLGHEPTMTHGMLPPYFLDGQGSQFMRYDSTEDANGIIGLRPIPNGEYVPLNDATATDIAKVSSEVTLAADTTVQALHFNANIKGSTSSVIHVLGGGVIATKKNISVKPILDFTQAPEGILYGGDGLNAVSLEGGIACTNVLLKEGGAEFVLKGVSPMGISGDVIINAGKLTLANQAVANDLSDCELTLHSFGELGLGSTSVDLQALRGCGRVTGGSATVFQEFSPGGSEETSLLTVSTLSLGPECQSTFRVGPYGDAVHATGDLTLSGTLNIAKAIGYKPGIYTLATCDGTLVSEDLRVGSKPEDMFVQILRDEPGKLRVECLEQAPGTILLFR